MAGRIENLRVSQWDNVRRGEPILSLYSPDFMTAEAEYLQAQTTAQLSNAPGLAGGDVGAANLGPFDGRGGAAQTRIAGDGAGRYRCDARASPNVWMRAPISGTIVDNKAQRGAAVNPGDVLYSSGTLVESGSSASIYEDDLSRVQMGQPLEAVTTAYPDQGFNGFRLPHQP